MHIANALFCLGSLLLVLKSSVSHLQLVALICACNTMQLVAASLLTVTALLLERSPRTAYRRIPFMMMPRPGTFRTTWAPLTTLVAFWGLNMLLTIYAVKNSFWVVVPYTLLDFLLVLIAMRLFLQQGKAALNRPTITAFSALFWLSSLSLFLVSSAIGHQTHDPLVLLLLKWNHVQ